MSRKMVLFFLLFGCRAEAQNFVLYGHPDEHGGAGVVLPVLVYSDGVTFVFVNEERITKDKVITFASEKEVTDLAAAIPAKTEAVEITITARDDQSKVVDYQKKPLGKTVEFAGKTIAVEVKGDALATPE